MVSQAARPNEKQFHCCHVTSRKWEEEAERLDGREQEVGDEVHVALLSKSWFC